jgi:hypothetical protein
MSFAYPSFLWAWAALSIPIIIHLFNFRKTVKIYFSNTRLLRQVKEETTQKRKLKQYLVLASRLLFLFFLVLAFAQPFLPARSSHVAGRNISIYLDNSFSLSAPAGNKTRGLDDAISKVREIISVFPAESRFQLLTADFAPYSNTFKTRAEIEDLLSQMRLSPLSRSQTEIIQRLPTESKDLFWVSDFQKSTFGENKSLPDSTYTIQLVPVSLQKTGNVFVDSLFLENPFAVGGERHKLTVRLRNSGEKALEALVVKFIMNDIQMATTTVSLPAAGQVETTFDVTGELRLLNTGRISFNDFTLGFDNEFFFTLNFSDRIVITEIKNTAQTTAVERVYGNRDLFQIQSFEAGNVDYGRMAQSDMVVLNGIDQPDGALSAALLSYLTTHGTLLLVPGTKPDVASYQKILSLPGVNTIAESSMSPLETPDYTNPLFENVFEERVPQLRMPQARRLLNWGKDRTALLKWKDGQPFLSVFGKKYVFASPLSEAYTDLANNALFVPVMYRIAAGSKRSEQRPYYHITQNVITIQADSLVGEDPVRLAGALEMIPPQRKTADRVLLEIPRFSMSAGYYHVLYKKDTLDLVAFNTAPEESELETYTPSEAKEKLGGGKNIITFEAATAEAFSNEIKERYLGTPLWKWMLVAALLFLLAEVLLIRFVK